MKDNKQLVIIIVAVIAVLTAIYFIGVSNGKQAQNG